MSELETQMELALQDLVDRGEIPQFVREHRVAAKRRFRFDFAWPEHKVALEIQGGSYVRGRHNRPKGMRDDCDKSYFAALGGWRVVYVTTDHVKSGEAWTRIAEVLRTRTPLELALLQWACPKGSHRGCDCTWCEKLMALADTIPKTDAT